MLSDEDLLKAEAEVEKKLALWKSPSEPEERVRFTERVRREKKKRRCKRMASKTAPEQSNASAAADPVHAALRTAREIREKEPEPSISLDKFLVQSRSKSKAETIGVSNVAYRKVDMNEGAPVSDSLGDGEPGSGAGGSEAARGLTSAGTFVDKHRTEIAELGANALEKKDLRAYEARRLEAQGCRAAKQQMMPLPMLLGMRKKQRSRDRKAKDLALASGMLIRSKRKNK